MKFSLKVLTIRAKLNLSQKELARLLSVSFATVNRWENAKTVPSKKTLLMVEQFCKANNIEIE